LNALVNRGEEVRPKINQRSGLDVSKKDSGEVRQKNLENLKKSKKSKKASNKNSKKQTI
jgi:hypothetical protein